MTHAFSPAPATLPPTNGHAPVTIAPRSAAPPTLVRKRDGRSVQPFAVAKIEVAIGKAFVSEGLAPDDVRIIEIAETAVASLPAGCVDIERVQDAVEVALMEADLHAVAKHYILYRQQRRDARAVRRHPDGRAVADYIHHSHYARHLPAERRRESYVETVARSEDMHLRRFAPLGDATLLEAIRWAFGLVREQRVLPSMRGMQFGGRAIEMVNNRLYNCCWTLIDRPRVFQEIFFLLLCGSGVGYSVQIDHVEKLPRLARIDSRRVVHFSVADTIKGWADALGALVQSFLDGAYIEYDYSRLRHEGSPLVTSGGLAPGHLPLKRALEAIREILTKAQGRRLRPIECHDINCLSADAVLSGGVRRSAMISLFSEEDSEMLRAKTGDWFTTSPWRQNANNSVHRLVDDQNKKAFFRAIDLAQEWGEPGNYFARARHYGANPCGEIGLNPVLTIDEDALDVVASLRARGRQIPTVKRGESYVGFAFCNLCEMNAAKFGSLADFEEVSRAAAIIGTLQASYTDMPYVGWVSEVIAAREALLGVSMAGMLDAPSIALDQGYQRRAASIVAMTNREIARRIGIRPGSRLTCVKPGGTAPLELGGVASGHSPHHARRYLKRVIANELEPIFRGFRAANPHMCIRKPNGDWVVEFPVEAPPNAIVKDDVPAIEFLTMVLSTQRHWVQPGTARPESSPGLVHNVSNTVTVKPDEWGAVADFIWKNRGELAGTALLSFTGDKDFAFAPNEAVRTDADEARWNKLVAGYQPVDYKTIVEETDGTKHVQEPACSGGACAL